jgi:hypothetical protein
LVDFSGRDFIAPCKCKGTSKYVHRACLDHWRAVKVFFQPNNITKFLDKLIVANYLISSCDGTCKFEISILGVCFELEVKVPFFQLCMHGFIRTVLPVSNINPMATVLSLSPIQKNKNNQDPSQIIKL